MSSENRDIRPEEIKNILIINLGGIGDFLLSLPALKALRNFYKESHITFLTLPRTLPIAQDSLYLDEVLSFELRLGRILPLLIKLRARRFDMAVNMRTITSWKSAVKMAIIFYILQVKYKVGRDTEHKGLFLDIKIPECEIGNIPEYEYDLNTVKALGAQAEYSCPEIEIHEVDFSYINNFLAENSVKEEDIILGINPGAPWPTKRWPAEKFAKVIDILKEKLHCKIIITGQPDELWLAQKIQRLSKSKLVIAVGKTSIKQLAALIKRCNVYISNDTGPMHIAAILKTPLIAIFGPGYLTRFDPRNISDKAVVLYKKVDCAPCNRVRCKALKCLKEISPEEVAEAVLRILREKR